MGKTKKGSMKTEMAKKDMGERKLSYGTVWRKVNR